MTIKVSGRSALILATGLFVCLAGPSQAAGTDGTIASSKPESAAPIALSKFTKHSTRHGKSYAHRKSGKLADKPSDKRDAASDVAAADSDNSSAIPPAVANANAQMATVDVPGGNAKAMSARANDILQAVPTNPADAQITTDTQVVAADQLNDVDRALRESAPPASTPPAAPPALASAEAQAVPAPVAAGNQSTAWDETSLIGKIFIGFGALLTMASAARMFMA